MPREETYPYDPFNTYPGICETDDRVVVSDEYLAFYDLSDEEIIELLQSGPLAATLSADNWEYYSSGVF